MTERDSQRLAGVHPELVAKIEKILDAMRVLGFPMMIVAGVRSLEEQQRLFAQGRTAPGAIVTNADGLRATSNHQVKGDGFGHAVDCAFVDDPTTARVETWDPRQPWDLYGLMAESLGLSWGGRWKRFPDKPHLELRAEQRRA